MGKVVFNMSMSLDGFVAGPNNEVDRIFKWYFSGDTDFRFPGVDLPFKVSRASAEHIQEASRKIEIVLGNGIRLFEHLGAEPTELETMGVIEGTGVTHLGYRVVRRDP